MYNRTQHLQMDSFFYMDSFDKQQFCLLKIKATDPAGFITFKCQDMIRT